LVFPDHSRRNYSSGRFVPYFVAAIRGLARSSSICYRVFGNRRDPRNARLHFGARERPARMADHSDAADLSADVELLRLESNFARCKGRMGKLGQAGTHCFRAGASVASAFPRVIPTGA